MDRLYKSFINAKNDTLIPIFFDDKTMESKYNPDNDAERKASNQSITSNIVLIFGIGSGLFIKKIAQNYPNVTFLAVEYSESDIIFLQQNNIFSSLYKINNIHIFSSDKLKDKLKLLYLPALYGNLQIIEQKAWIDQLGDKYNSIKTELKLSIDEIAKDFSVQCHFGKIWQRNILSNIISNNKYNLDFTYKYDNSKEAYIIAAGPSLDKKIEILKNQKNKFIISTDTAAQVLIKNNITPEIIITVDGQNISYNHFHNCLNKNILFIFDICGNSKAAKKLIDNSEKIFFINTGHPLCNNIKNIQGKLPEITAGSGTVTIAGLSLAIKMGFKKINIIGADFAYIHGKPYAKGTYLDNLYNLSSSKVNNSEKMFNKLQFRTELIQENKHKFTTTVLQSYKKSLENYLEEYECNYLHKDDIYVIDLKKSYCEFKEFSKQTLSLDNFFKELISLIGNQKEISPYVFINNPILISLLPYIAYLRAKKFYNNISISELLKLAYKNIVRYN